jgi:hypothetical protein
MATKANHGARLVLLIKEAQEAALYLVGRIDDKSKRI